MGEDGNDPTRALSGLNKVIEGSKHTVGVQKGRRCRVRYRRKDFQATGGMQEFPNPRLGETDRPCEAIGDSQPGLTYLISCKRGSIFATERWAL